MIGGKNEKLNIKSHQFDIFYPKFIDFPKRKLFSKKGVEEKNNSRENTLYTPNLKTVGKGRGS